MDLDINKKQLDNSGIRFDDDEKSHGEAILSVVLIIVIVGVIVAIYYLGLKTSVSSSQESQGKVAGAYDENYSSITDTSSEANDSQRIYYDLISLDVPNALSGDISDQFTRFYPQLFISNYNLENLAMLSSDLGDDVIFIVNKFETSKDISSVKYTENMQKYYQTQGIQMTVYDKLTIEKNMFEYRARYSIGNKNYKSLEKIIILPKLTNASQGYQISVLVNEQSFNNLYKNADQIINSIKYE